MDSVLTFVTSHETLVLVVAYWVFSVLVSWLHRPTPESSKAYSLFFSAVQAIAGSLGRITDKRIPGLPSNGKG